MQKDMKTRRQARKEPRVRTRKNRHSLYPRAFNPKKSVHIPTHALIEKINKFYRKTPYIKHR